MLSSEDSGISDIERLLVKLKKTGTGWTAKELKQIGVGWPPPKGWRKRLLKEISGKRETPAWPSDQTGYLVRKTGTGRAHHFAGGAPLCRVARSSRYVFTTEKPDIPICKMCTDVLQHDPMNSRKTRVQQ